MLALAFLLAAPFLRDQVIDRDEAIYATFAQRWAAGDVPYRDVFDHKPPVIYTIYRLALATGGESLVPVRVLFTALTGLTGLAAYLLLRRMRPRAPRFPALACGALVIFYATSAVTAGGTANTETPMALLLGLATLLLLAHDRLRPRTAEPLIGLCLSLALLTKPVCLGEVTLIAAFALFRHPRALNETVARAARLAAGGLAPAAVFALYLLARGGLPAAWEAVVKFNALYVGAAPFPLPDRLATVSERVAIGFTPLALGAAGLAASLLRRPRPSWAVFLLAWCGAAAAGVLATGRTYPHYYQQLVLPLALAAGLLVIDLEEKLREEARTVALVRAAWVVTCAILAYLPARATLSWMEMVARLRGWQPVAAAEVARLTQPGDPILVFGADPEVYFRSRRTPSTRYIVKYHVKEGPDPLASLTRERFLADLARRPPKVVVIPRDDAVIEDRTTSEEEWRTLWWPRLQHLLPEYRTITRPSYLLLLPQDAPQHR